MMAERPPRSAARTSTRFMDEVLTVASRSAHPDTGVLRQGTAGAAGLVEFCRGAVAEPQRARPRAARVDRARFRLERAGRWLLHLVPAQRHGIDRDRLESELVAMACSWSARRRCARAPAHGRPPLSARPGPGDPRGVDRVAIATSEQTHSCDPHPRWSASPGAHEADNSGTTCSTPPRLSIRSRSTRTGGWACASGRGAVRRSWLGSSRPSSYGASKRWPTPLGRTHQPRLCACFGTSDYAHVIVLSR